MNIEKLISELQERNVKKIDTYIYDEYGNHAITPKGRTLVKDITTDSFNQGALAVIEEMQRVINERKYNNPLGERAINRNEALSEIEAFLKTLEDKIKSTNTADSSLSDEDVN